VGAEERRLERLTRFGREVTLIHRREEFRASKIMLDRTRANPKIKMLPNTIVEDIYDVTKNVVTGVKLRNTLTGEQAFGSSPCRPGRTSLPLPRT